jgi:PAS domain-containing protein
VSQKLEIAKPQERKVLMPSNLLQKGSSSSFESEVLSLHSIHSWKDLLIRAWELSEEAPTWLLFTVLIGGLATGIVTGTFWYKERQAGISAFFAALSGKVEPTGQAYKGIESLVLSGAEAHAEQKQRNEAPLKLTDNFRAHFATLVRNVAAAKNPISFQSKLQVRPRRKTSDPALQFVTLKENADVRTDTQNSEKLQPFLFLPSTSLHAARSLTDATIKSPNADIAANTKWLGAVWGQVAELTGKNLFENGSSKIVQAYFLLSTGALLIHEAGLPETEQYKHYVRQFTGHTFLPDRPYFWSAVATRTDRQTSGIPRSDTTWDYSTNAYIDLGTNGPIKTYCWAFVGADMPGGPDAVLCIDVELSEAPAVIEKNLRSVGAEITDVRCDLDSSSCRYPDGEPDTVLTDAALNAPGQLEVFGGINVLSAEPIKFTVPLRTYPENGTAKLWLIECNLDLKKSQTRNTVLILISIVSFGLALLAASRLLGRYLIGPSVLNVTLRNLDYVMDASSDPYVRVNPEDKIEKFNKSFKAIVGDVEVGEDLKNFLQWENVHEYESQKPHRIEERPSQYRMMFSGGKCFHAYGAAIPGPVISGRRVPHTFAILQKEVESPKAEAATAGNK